MAKIKEENVSFTAWRRLNSKLNRKSAGEKKKSIWTCLLQNTWYSAEKSTQAAGLETRTKRSVTPTWLEALTSTHSSTFLLVLSLFWPLSFGASPLCPRLFPAFLFLSAHVPFLFLPPLSSSLHPLLILSQDALMSARTCCHIPPVPSSARHDRIRLNSAAAGGAANKLHKPGYIKRAGRNRRGGRAGMVVNIVWTGDLHVPRILCSPNLADTMTNGRLFPGSSSAPLQGLPEFDPNSTEFMCTVYYLNIY